MPNPILYNITMPSGNVYDLVDQGARELIKELLNFHEWLGITTSDVTDGSTINPIIINGESVTAVAGDVVSRNDDHTDYVLSQTGVWQSFGTLTGLGSLAFKNSASGDYTPAGTVSGSFAGNSLSSSGKFTPSGNVSSSFSGNSMNSTGTYTPAGSISGITAGTKTVKQLTNVGTLPVCTMPDFTVVNGNLIITAGSYTPGTLPTGEDVTVGDGNITNQGTFNGTEDTVSVSGTPSGSVTSSFTGTEDDVNVSGTPTGSVTATFAGTAATITVE